MKIGYQYQRVQWWEHCNISFQKWMDSIPASSMHAPKHPGRSEKPNSVLLSPEGPEMKQTMQWTRKLLHDQTLTHMEDEVQTTYLISTGFNHKLLRLFVNAKPPYTQIKSKINSQLLCRQKGCRAAPSVFIFCLKDHNDPNCVSIAQLREPLGGSPPPSCDPWINI